MFDRGVRERETAGLMAFQDFAGRGDDRLREAVRDGGEIVANIPGQDGLAICQTVHSLLEVRLRAYSFLLEGFSDAVHRVESNGGFRGLSRDAFKY